jgi:hypothetical protein
MRSLLLTVVSLSLISCAPLGKRINSKIENNRAPVASQEKIRRPSAEKKIPPKKSPKENPPKKAEKIPKDAILEVARLATVKKAVVQRREGLIYEAILKGKKENCSLVLVKVKNPKGEEKDYRVKLCAGKYEITPL